MSPVPDGNYTNQDIHLVANIIDNDSVPEELSVTWSSEEGELPLDVVIDDDGNHSAFTLLSSGNQDLIVTVSDDQGNTSREFVTIIVTENTAPVCSFTNQNQNHSISNSLLLEGFAQDTESQNTSLVVDFTSDLDGILGSTSPEIDGLVTFETQFETVGVHTITMTVTDETGSTCNAEQIWSVMNGPVVEITVPQENDMFATGSSVSFEAIITDIEDPYSVITAEWNFPQMGSYLRKA